MPSTHRDLWLIHQLVSTHSFGGGLPGGLGGGGMVGKVFTPRGRSRAATTPAATSHPSTRPVEATLGRLVVFSKILLVYEVVFSFRSARGTDWGTCRVNDLGERDGGCVVDGGSRGFQLCSTPVCTARGSLS